MWLMRLIFRVNVEAEAQKHESSLANGHSLIQTMNIRVENPNLNNMAIQDVPILNSDKIICSRLKRDDTLMVRRPGGRFIQGQATCCTSSANLPTCITRNW